jgi:DNA-binding GntR family transcriptional regulator
MSATTRKSTAYDFLKQAILNQRYPPGQTLVEATIADELGMSRTPVREAIRELSREGLVETIPNRGAIVRALSPQELLDIFDIKIRLEGLCAARAAERNGPATASKLLRATKAMAAAAKAKDRQAYLQADEAYHAAIYAGAQNERAHQIVSDLNAQWHRLRAGMAAIESRMETAVEEHRRIAEAIGAGDAEAAETAMRVHLENLRDEVRILLEDFVAPLGGGQ